MHVVKAPFLYAKDGITSELLEAGTELAFPADIAGGLETAMLIEPADATRSSAAVGQDNDTNAASDGGLNHGVEVPAAASAPVEVDGAEGSGAAQAPKPKKKKK